MRTLALALLLAAAPAYADDCDLLDPATGTGATQIAQGLDACMADPSKCEPAVKPPPRERHGFIAGGQATLGTIAQATSGGDSLAAGEASANGRVGWRAGLQACASTDVILGSVSRGDTAFHLVFPWPFVETAILGFEQQWQLRPRLDASRIYLRRLYSSTDFQAGIAAISWARPNGGRAALLTARTDAMMRDQDRTGATLQTNKIVPYESTSADLHVEAFPMTWVAMYPFTPNVNDPAQVPSSHLTRIGLADVKGRHGKLSYEFAAGELFAGRRLEHPFAGAVGIGWGPWSLRGERSAFLAMDDTITIENRATTAYNDGRWRAGAFAALTHTSEQPRAQLTGGGSAGVDVALPEQVKLALDVEVARSYYARLDADPLPRPEFASVGTVQLSRTFTVNPTAHVSR